jgi:hypothetical protein
VADHGPGAFHISGDPLPRLHGRSVLGHPEIVYYGPFGPMWAHVAAEDELTTVTGPAVGAASLAWGPASARGTAPGGLHDRLAQGIEATVAGVGALLHTAGHRPGPCVPLRIQMEDRWLRMRFCGARGATLEDDGAAAPLMTGRPSRVSALARPPDVALWLLVRASRLAWHLDLHPVAARPT